MNEVGDSEESFVAVISRAAEQRLPRVEIIFQRDFLRDSF